MFFSSVEDAAKLSAGNWKTFTAFFWTEQPDDADQWMIYHTSTRDSGLLAKSNEAAILAKLEPYFATGDDLRTEHFRCSLHGHIDAISIRVYAADGQITQVFRAFHELMLSLEQYPVLDDTDHGRRVHEDTIENIRDQGWQFIADDIAPKDWPDQVFSWLWDNDDGAVEPMDDGGGYPTEDQVKKALTALDIPLAEVV